MRIITLSVMGLFLAGCQTNAEAPAQPEAETVKAEAPAAEKVAAAAEESPWADIPVVSVDELDALMAKKSCTVVDANGEKTREELGVIPGAVRLPTGTEYELASTLPEDKNANLVFYCSSTKCSAAPKAAARAKEAGYANVSTLKVGIKGWVEAGKPVEKTKG